MPAQNYRLKQRFLAGAVWDELFTAAVDLSTCQYRFVTPGSVNGEVVGATGASQPTPIGVLQNAPTATQIARVRVMGLTSMVACPGACNLTPGVFIRSAADGSACLSGSGIALGRWMAASTAVGTTGCALINCLTVSSCIGATA